MNYHLFIVDEISFKYHLEYGFVGTGSANTSFNIKLWTDIIRLKENDKIIFYVQNNKKFYGFFKVTSTPFFDSNHYLQPNIMPYLGGKNNIRLQYRALMNADNVFSEGIEEFELIDILPEKSSDVLWSILYRKLKGSRGCSPVFKIEYDIIFKKISEKNNNKKLVGCNFSYNNGRIKITKNNSTYQERQISYDIKSDILKNVYFEHHLHSLLLDKLPNLIFNSPEWVGNEVYSGSGMQSIDILSIDNNNIFNIIEVKKDEIPKNITEQVRKYIQWLKNRFQNFISTNFQPILFGKKITGSTKQNSRLNEFTTFNNLNISLPIKYFEYEVDYSNLIIIINEIDYSNNWNIIGSLSI